METACTSSIRICLKPLFLVAILLFTFVAEASPKTQFKYKFLKKGLRKKIVHLESWVSSFKRQGKTLEVEIARSEKIKAMRSDNYGLGYWARLPIQRGEKLFSIPYEACINYNITLEDPDSNMTSLVYSKIRENNEIGNEAALALYLIIASRRQPEESKYYPYLKFLPGKINLPLLWRPDQLEILQYSPMRKKIESVHRSLIDIYKFIVTNPIVLAEAPAVLSGKTRFTLREFKWAVATIWSRSFYLDTFGYVRIRDRNMIKIYDPGEDGKKDAKGRKYHSAKPKLIAIEYLDKIKKSDLAGERPSQSHVPPAAQVMIPMLDTLNHNGSESHRYRYNPSNGMIEFTVARDIDEGDEILFNYGSFSNHDLFLIYGFIDVNNTLNHIQLPIRARLLTSLNHFQQKLLSWRVSNPHIILDHKGRPIGDTELVLRILTFDDFGGTAYELDRLLDNEPPKSEVLRVKLYKLLHDLCNATLSMYNTTLELDKAELRRVHPPWYRLALNIRIEEKYILKGCMNYSKSQVF